LLNIFTLNIRKKSFLQCFCFKDFGKINDCWNCLRDNGCWEVIKFYFIKIEFWSISFFCCCVEFWWL